LAAIRSNFVIGRAWMAIEFAENNDANTRTRFAASLEGIPVEVLPHTAFKERVPSAIGLVRTGDTTQYANLLLESA
jgi:D-ribose pyranase